MSIGTITYGTVSEANAIDSTITPSIPGSADAGDLLVLIWASRTVPTSFSETGAGAWTGAYTTLGTSNQIGVWYASGAETTAPTITWVGNMNPACAVVVRVKGGASIGNFGTLFEAGGANDQTVGPIGVPTLTSSDGVVFCIATYKGLSNSPATGESISTNSTGSWVTGKTHYTTLGADLNTAIFHNIYTAAPTLAAETVTFTGGTSGTGQNGLMFEVLSAGSPSRRRMGGVQFVNNLVIPRQGKAIW